MVSTFLEKPAASTFRVNFYPEMEAAGKISVPIHQTTQCHMPQDGNLETDCHENIKFHGKSLIPDTCNLPICEGG
jgi:hypothetical protein